MSEKQTESGRQQGKRQERKQDGQPEGGSSGEAESQVQRAAWFPWFVFLILSGALLYSVNQGPSGDLVPTWQQFKQLVKDDGVKPDSVVLENSRVRAVLKAEYQPGEVEKTKGNELPVFVSIDSENRDYYIRQLDQLDVGWKDQTGTDWWTVALAWAPLLLFVLFIGLIIFRARQAAQAGPMGMLGQFGKSQHRVASREKVDVTLNDVAGIEEAKAEVHELIRFLREPGTFQDLGARVPRGVLLQGPPGCGKTLVARAIAGEADVPFFSISGSDFMEMFVGVGARRVRDLFAQAKENAPCMIFLDEIDSVGKKRGQELMAGGGHGEREQTLNAILSEMDGFEPNDQVIVLAATNRPDVLDPALTRRGRFDRQVDIPLPDIVGRTEILRIHSSRVKLAEDVSLKELARATPMFSGADLAAMVNEAAIIAGMKGQDHVGMDEMRAARDKVRFGRARKSRRLDEEQRVTSAYHEAGHALLQATLEHADPIEKVTIIPRGQALGATFALPEKDRYGLGRNYLLDTMRVLCGGRVAEHRKTGDVSSGAADDILRLTTMVRKMVREWGMSERVGFIRLASDPEEDQQLMATREYSDELAAEIDEEIRRLVQEAYEDAERHIEDGWDHVQNIAEALLEYETLTAEDVRRLMNGEELDRPSMDEPLREKSGDRQDTAASAKQAASTG